MYLTFLISSLQRQKKREFSNRVFFLGSFFLEKLFTLQFLAKKCLNDGLRLSKNIWELLLMCILVWTKNKIHHQSSRRALARSHHFHPPNFHLLLILFFFKYFLLFLFLFFYIHFPSPYCWLYVVYAVFLLCGRHTDQ